MNRMKTTTVKERRRHKRYWIKGLKQRLRKSRLLGLSSKPTSEEYPCLDISESGLQFIAKKVFKPANQILLDISTPLTRNEPIQAKARVVWSRSTTNLQFCMIGVQFSSVKKSQRAQFKMLVERAGEDKDKIPQRIRVKIIKEVASRL